MGIRDRLAGFHQLSLIHIEMCIRDSIIAYSLVNLVKSCDDCEGTMKTIAAGGFKDITRIASSSPVMWENICLSNQEQILRLIDSFCGELGHKMCIRDRLSMSAGLLFVFVLHIDFLADGLAERHFRTF